jgi:hypothetical protein
VKEVVGSIYRNKIGRRSDRLHHGSLIDRAVVLSDGRVVHDGPLGDLAQHRRGLGSYQHHDHGQQIGDDHDQGAETLLGGAVEP